MKISWKKQLTNNPSDTDLTATSEIENKYEPGAKYGTYTDKGLYEMINEALKTEGYALSSYQE